MSFDAREIGTQTGAPIEYYQFDRGAEHWRYVTTPDDATFQGFAFTAIPGLARTAISQSDENVSMQLTVTLPRTAALAAELVGSLSPTPISVILWRNHRGEGDDQARAIFVGEISIVSFEASVVKITLDSVPGAVGGSMGRVYFQRTCPFMLYDRFCGSDITAHRFPATVSNVTGSSTIITVTDPSDLGHNPSRYEGGILQWGDRRSMILQETSAGVFVLQTPLLGLAIDDAVTVIHGCRRTSIDCAATHDNLERFGGFELIPLRSPWQRVT